MRFACIQQNSGEDIQENLSVAEKLIRMASNSGAKYISTPEVTDQMMADRRERIEECFTQKDHPAVKFFSNLANELSIYLFIGSLIIKSDDGLLNNRSFVFTPEGEIQDTYDKIHLCDTDLPCGTQYRESALYKKGEKAVVTNVDGSVIGLSICRDLRFGSMYKALSHQGASIILVPAAWLKATGDPHWEVLLRARAIETGCYIVAANQVGKHSGNRETYGNSMIISPWGDIITKSNKDAEDIIIADLDLSVIDKSKKVIPCPSHKQEYVF